MSKHRVDENEFVSGFKACRRTSTPLVAIETPDAAATMAQIRKTVLANGEKPPLLEWDCVRGLVGLNDLGKTAFNKLGAEPMQTLAAADALFLCAKLPESSIVFLHNFHRQLVDVATMQAAWNLRDLFKLNKRMLVMMGPGFMLPPEVSGDIMVLNEPLPTREMLSEILDQQHRNAELPLPTEEARTAALDALVGLPMFTAEQISAMSLTKAGINVTRLWDRKIKAIENTEGLRVWKGRPDETMLDELRGIDNAVSFMDQLIAADAFGAIVFVDEMDKAFAGGMSEHTGDSGVSKDQVGTLLSYIEDTGALGVLLAGIAGTGKSQLAKAMSVKARKPLIVFDLGGMKGGVVGKSEGQIRTALKVVTATAEGRVLFVGTANRTTLFTPELNRRFPDQFMYDLPNDEARSAIWPVYIAKNGLTVSQSSFPAGFDAGWTGAEIKRACEKAALFGKSVVDVARFIVPQSVSGRKTIEALRREADGRFLSASYPGIYRIPDVNEGDEVLPGSTRVIEVR